MEVVAMRIGFLICIFFMLPVAHYRMSAIVHPMLSGSNQKSKESLVDSKDPATVHFL